MEHKECSVLVFARVCNGAIYMIGCPAQSASFLPAHLCLQR